MIDSSLFGLITIITLVDAYKSRLISLVLKLVPEDVNFQQTSSDLIDLKKELSTISIVNEFAKHAKLQRKINKLQEKKKELAKDNAFKLMKIRYTLVTAIYVAVLISLSIILWLYSNESLVQLPADWFWPISSFFDWSYCIPGSVTVPCWVAISSSGSKTLAKIF